MSKKQPKVHKQKILESLEKNLGLVTPTCKEVGISRNQFYIYYNTDVDFKNSVDDINEIIIDFAENQLFKNIKDRDKASIFFYLKYRGRKRGYSDSVDVNLSGDININLKNLFGFEDEDNIEE
jgi:hypothetical protein